MEARSPAKSIVRPLDMDLSSPRFKPNRTSKLSSPTKTDCAPVTSSVSMSPTRTSTSPQTPPMNSKSKRVVHTSKPITSTLSPTKSTTSTLSPRTYGAVTSPPSTRPRSPVTPPTSSTGTYTSATTTCSGSGARDSGRISWAQVAATRPAAVSHPPASGSRALSQLPAIRPELAGGTGVVRQKHPMRGARNKNTHSASPCSSPTRNTRNVPSRSPILSPQDSVSFSPPSFKKRRGDKESSVKNFLLAAKVQSARASFRRSISRHPVSKRHQQFSAAQKALKTRHS